MSARTLEIIGRYEGEKFRFKNPTGSVVIGSIRLNPQSKEIAAGAGVTDVDLPITIKGDDDELLEYNQSYRFLGTFNNYSNPRTDITEKQFHFRTFVSHVPHDEEGLIRYIADAGKGNGIGPSKSRDLIHRFGAESVLVEIRKSPQEIAAIAGIPIDAAERFVQKLRDQAATENAKLEIDKLLSGKGFPKTLGNKVVKEWGNKAAAIVTSDPFKLLQFRGVGFKLCDGLYKSLGLNPRSIHRQALCLWYSMASNNSGHTWYQAVDQTKHLAGMIGGTVDVRGAIVQGKQFAEADPDHYGAIATVRTDGPDGPIAENGNTLWISEARHSSQERTLARLIVEALNENESQTITIYEDEEVTREIPASVARCNRCGRALTADTVHVVDGKPYGPTCVEKIEG